ncbi:MAG: phosphate acyltransferase PlsX [Lentisphaerae bacterium]|nr:phosphate acyltransferase PlsX [Lentisphaerota bacterium]
MRIAIDAMGGDFAPREIVRGGVLAAKQLKDIDVVILVGDATHIRHELQLCGASESDRLQVRHASEVIGMEDAPAIAVRKKRDSSINRCVSLIKEGEADAAVSAGNSGAFSAAAMFGLGRVKGVARPVIAAVLPTRDRPLLLVDSGANMDCEPAWLAQFAIMGSAYSQAVLRQPNPVVGLLSIGTEDSKGNEVTKRAFQLIQRTGVNFRGNVEGRDLFLGKTDVVVCDGFVGNVVLKTTESVAHAISFWMKKEFVRHPLRILGAILLKGALTTLKSRMDPEIYGGAPLLGVNGSVIITHGASTQKAIFHAVRVAALAARNNVTDEIASRICAMPLHDTPLPSNNK